MLLYKQTDLFYNTNIGIYIFILSKEGTKRKERKGKIQLINATSEEFWTQLRKSLGKKRKEISAKQGVREDAEKPSHIVGGASSGAACGQ